MKESVFKLNSFIEEARIISQCKHPHIINILSASSTGCVIPKSRKPIAYIAMSYAKFGELFKIIQETGPLNEILTRTYFFQLLKGIEYLHSMNICHRDIKLENLLLDKDLKLIISDFGSSAKIRMEGEKPMPFNTSLLAGTKEYNPPEMYTEKFYYGEKADIFAAGVCLFLMLLGHPPFREASSRDPYFKKLARKNNYWQVYKTTNVSLEFKDLFEKMTEPDYTKRIELRDIYVHQWMMGSVYTVEELRSEMHNRIQNYLKKGWRYARQSFKTKKQKQAKRKDSPICKELSNK